MFLFFVGLIILWKRTWALKFTPRQSLALLLIGSATLAELCDVAQPQSFHPSSGATRGAPHRVDWILIRLWHAVTVCVKHCIGRPLSF